MRISDHQRAVILTAVEETFGSGAKVWLFGSRVDDSKRGGDIDLLIKTDLVDIEQLTRAEIALLATLNRQLGEQKIDILIDYPTKNVKPPIYQMALEQGVKL